MPWNVGSVRINMYVAGPVRSVSSPSWSRSLRPASGTEVECRRPMWHALVMPSLRARLTTILPTILPKSDSEAINGTEILRRLPKDINDAYAENTIRVHLSTMASEQDSVIAKVSRGHGYFLRVKEAIAERAPLAPAAAGGATGAVALAPTAVQPGSRNDQREEKFRAVYIRHAELGNAFPVSIDHTRAKKQEQGRNKWKYPDVVLLRWEVGVITDQGYRLDPHLLDVKRGLGEQPFELTSVELKDDLSLTDLRSSFFQCVSNSKWAHHAVLAIANHVTDATLLGELQRLGSSYDVNIVSFGLPPAELDKLPSADKILALPLAEFEALAATIDVVRIASGRPRSDMDWDHILDMRTVTDDFVLLFRWIAQCLEERTPYRFLDYTGLAEIQDRYE